MRFPPLQKCRSGGNAFKILTAPGEQVSETLGKDWVFMSLRRAERADYKQPWEADVLPLHHSRVVTEKLTYAQ